MTPYQFSGGLLLAAALLIGIFWVLGDPSRHLAADELYGCAIKQQAPNGDCQ